MSGRDRRQRRRRAAVVGGAAVAAKHHHDNRVEGQQQEAAAAAPTGEAPVEATAPAPDSMEQLKKLGELHEQGVLTDAEFETEKAKILAG